MSSVTQGTFIGRGKELAALRAAYDAPRSHFLPIYGRRRVGKSELILHFSKPHPTIYFLAKKAPAHEQMREFLEIASHTLKEPLLASLDPHDWKKILETI